MTPTNRPETNTTKERKTEQGSPDLPRQREEQEDPTTTIKTPLEGGHDSPERVDSWKETKPLDIISHDPPREAEPETLP